MREQYRHVQMAGHDAVEMQCDMSTVLPNTALEPKSGGLGLENRNLLSEYSRLHKVDLNDRNYGLREP